MRKTILSKMLCILLAMLIGICGIFPDFGSGYVRQVSAAEPEETEQTILQQYIPKVDLSNVIENGAIMKDEKLQLPSAIMDHKKKADVSWTSSNQNIISDDGTVKWEDQDTSVVLTAHVSLEGVTVTKDFTVPVLSVNGQISSFKEDFLVNSYVAAGDKLKSSYGAGQITYSGSDLIAEDGTISQDIAEASDVTITATFTLGGTSASRTFKVHILPGDSSKYMCYTRIVDSYEQYDENLAFSMYLAYSEDGESYEALNYNSGVLFATGYYRDNVHNMETNLLDYPYLFYLKDGRYAVMSQYLDMGNDQKNPDLKYDEDHKGMVAVYTSSDLLHYSKETFIRLSDDYIKNATCEYDTEAENYVIHWEDVNGNFYKTTMKDVLDQNTIVETKPGNVLCFDSKQTDITDAVPRNIIPVKAEISDHVTKKLRPLVNTDVIVPRIKALSEQDITGSKVTAVYSDGSTSEKEVDWDYSNVDFSKLGSTYTITGTVHSGNGYGFGNALDLEGKCYLYDEEDKIKETYSLTQNWADPNICYWNGKYYFVATNDGNGNIGFYLRESDTIKGLFEEGVRLHKILDKTGDETAFWAPELHVVDGKLSMFFAVSFYARVMQLEGDDPTDPDAWGEVHEVMHDNGKYFNNHAMAIDMTYFEADGKSYVVWSGREERNGWGRGALLYIATCDREKPWILTSDAVLIGGDVYSWESNHGVVNEGAYAVIRDGTIYLTYSGASVDNTYEVGLLKAKVGDDLLDPDNWSKNNYPILSSFAVEGEFGTGHSCFVEDANGELLFVYHARGPKWNSPRTVGVRRVQFDMDGEPNLTLTDENDLLEQYREVTAEVIIADPNAADPADDANTGNTNTGNTNAGNANGDASQAVTPGGQTNPVVPGGQTNPVTPDTPGGSAPVKVKNTSIKNVKVLSNKKARITLAMKVKGIAGYQIRYSVKNSMKSSKMITMKKSSQLSATTGKLKKGKKYYFQVRTYQIVNNKKYYSNWSKKKTVRA